MAQTLPEILSKDERDALLKVARDAANEARTPKKQIAAWRDFVMIYTGLLAGPRVSELCSLKISDINLADAVLSIKGGKGDKDRNVEIGAKLLTILTEWIGDRRTGWLFPGPVGKKKEPTRLAPRTFQLRLQELAKKAGIVRAIHPHMLRHTFATALLDKGVDLRVIQELLGHSSVSITEIYTHVRDSRRKAAVNLLD